MRLVIPNIGWHGERDRVMAVAFHPFMNILMTGGSDSSVKHAKYGEDDDEDENLYKEDKGYIKIWEIIKP